MNQIVNRAVLRRLILAQADKVKPGKISRVSADFMDEADRVATIAIRKFVSEQVHRHRKGVTLKPEVGGMAPRK